MNEPAYYTPTTMNNIFHSSGRGGGGSWNWYPGSNRRPDGKSSIMQDRKKHASMRPSVEVVRLFLFGISSTAVSRFKEWAMSLLVNNPSLRNLSPFYLVFCHCFKQWRIQDRGPGTPPPLLFRPNWGSKGRKHFLGRPPPPLIRPLIRPQRPSPPLPTHTHTHTQPYLRWDSSHVITTVWDVEVHNCR